MKYKRCTVNGVRMLEHRAIVERALGKSLPKKAVVHHVNGIEDNKNLVVCPDQAYHKLIHRRQEAFEATGNYEARRCMVCSKHDLIENMVLWSKKGDGHYAHRLCRNELHLKYVHARKATS